MAVNVCREIMKFDVSQLDLNTIVVPKLLWEANLPQLKRNTRELNIASNKLRITIILLSHSRKMFLKQKADGNKGKFKEYKIYEFLFLKGWRKNF